MDERILVSGVCLMVTIFATSAAFTGGICSAQCHSSFVLILVSVRKITGQPDPMFNRSLSY